jgi:hypothetical protein
MDQKFSFGNDPAKIQRYRDFWNLDHVKRPLVGFSFVGWFPLKYFSASLKWKVNDRIGPERIDPSEWLSDQERLLTEGEKIDDDIIRGASPTQVAFPCFLPAALGCKIRVLPDTVLAEERKLSWEEALEVRLDPENPWFKKYLEFAGALVKRAAGRYPVGHSAELGPTDLHAVLRGHNESLLDLVDAPEKTAELLENLGKIFVAFNKALWEKIPRYRGGCYDAQYNLWAPGTIVRLQEDATASFSPGLYRKLVQPVDRMIAAQFECSFIHLHSTSMFLLDSFLEIEELRCFQINIEPFNIPAEGMIPYFRAVQAARRPLVVRGTPSPDELKRLLDSLAPAGLYLQLLIQEMSEADAYARILDL